MKMIAIKNMVCDRCKKVVREELEKQGLVVSSVELGLVLIENEVEIKWQDVDSMLISNGFSRIQDKDLVLLESIKHIMLDQIGKLPVANQQNLSEVLSTSLGRDYSSISKFFSKEEGITIEKYYQKLKLEKVKALIQEEELTFSEISYLLNYANSNHLARQFKTHTGMTMSQYQQLGNWNRSSFDKIV